MTLFIDTSDFNNLRLALIGEKLSEFNTAVKFNENYRTNELLEKFLKKNKTQPKDLKHLVVCTGPGSFTGIRVGVSLAQALGFALGITVTGIEKKYIPSDLSELTKRKLPNKLLLHYGAKPNITKAKKKKRS